MKKIVLAAALGLVACHGALAAGEKIAVVTPYLSAVATAEMVNGFKKEAAAKGWTVDVVDTAGDMGAFASRIEDVAATKPAGIVLVSVNPEQVQAQVDKAAAAGIPVVTIDGAKNKSVVTNVTSDNYVLGKTSQISCSRQLAARAILFVSFIRHIPAFASVKSHLMMR